MRRQSPQLSIPNNEDSTQTLDLTPPRGPNFRPETSGLMVIALAGHLIMPQYLKNVCWTSEQLDT